MIELFSKEACTLYPGSIGVCTYHRDRTFGVDNFVFVIWDYEAHSRAKKEEKSPIISHAVKCIIEANPPAELVEKAKISNKVPLKIPNEVMEIWENNDDAWYEIQKKLREYFECKYVHGYNPDKKICLIY